MWILGARFRYRVSYHGEEHATGTGVEVPLCVLCEHARIQGLNDFQVSRFVIGVIVDPDPSHKFRVYGMGRCGPYKHARLQRCALSASPNVCLSQ